MCVCYSYGRFTVASFQECDQDNERITMIGPRVYPQLIDVP